MPSTAVAARKGILRALVCRGAGCELSAPRRLWIGYRLTSHDSLQENRSDGRTTCVWLDCSIHPIRWAHSRKPLAPRNVSAAHVTLVTWVFRRWSLWAGRTWANQACSIGLRADGWRLLIPRLGLHAIGSRI